MSVGLALIARNEETRLPTLLNSIRGAFDQVVLLDTGSKDKTIEVFEEWAEAEAKAQPGFIGISATGKWQDDFAAARRAADELLETEWTCWADCDDEITGAAAIRQLCAQASPDLAAYIAGYDYGQDHFTGRCICYLRRERLVRRGRGHWTGRVHEAQIIDGPVQQIPDDILLWHHRKTADAPSSSKRNLKILRGWLADEPENARVLMYLGAEHLAKSHYRKAIGYFRRYLTLKTGWDEERAQQHRRLSMCHMAMGRRDLARKSAYEALHVKPAWPDSYLTLAQCAHMDDEHPRAIEWAERVLELGVPETLLIINPLDYQYEPLKVKAGSLAALDKITEAVDVGARALELVPHDRELREHWQGWRNKLESDQMAETFANLARYLVSVDEQEKANRIMSCVPHVAERHSLINQVRGELYDRTGPLYETAREHYSADGVNPPQGFDLDNGRQFAQQLPRAGFAANGILTQLAEARS